MAAIDDKCDVTGGSWLAAAVASSSSTVGTSRAGSSGLG